MSGRSFEVRVQSVVDYADESVNHFQVDGPIRWTGLRYLGPDLRRVSLIEGSLNRSMLVQLATCSLIERHQNAVIDDFADLADFR